MPDHWLRFTSGSVIGYASPKTVLLFSCILSTFVIGVGYKGTLLSMLVKKEYEHPIDTVQDLVECGLPLFIPAKTSIHSALRDDSRDSVQLIMKTRSEAYPFRGVNPPWVVESYVNSKFLSEVKPCWSISRSCSPLFWWHGN